MKMFKERITKAANNFSRTFKYINLFIAIIDEVFIMPQINHYNDTTLSSYNKPNERNFIEWNEKVSKRKCDHYWNMHRRKFDINDEYLENINTPVVKRYEKLSDVPKRAKWDIPNKV